MVPSNSDEPNTPNPVQMATAIKSGMEPTDSPSANTEYRQRIGRGVGLILDRVDKPDQQRFPDCGSSRFCPQVFQFMGILGEIVELNPLSVLPHGHSPAPIDQRQFATGQTQAGDLGLNGAIRGGAGVFGGPLAVCRAVLMQEPLRILGGPCHCTVRPGPRSPAHPLGHRELRRQHTAMMRDKRRIARRRVACQKRADQVLYE